MKNIQKKIFTPQFITIYFLGILSILASISRFVNDDQIGIRIVFHLAVIIIPAFTTYIIINFFQKRKLDLFDTPITNLILFLIIDPSQNLLLTAAIAMSVQLIRSFVRYKGLPIFNPAASGLVFIAILEILVGFEKIGSFVTWWGVSFSPRFMNNYSYVVFLTLIFGVFLAYKEARIRSVVVSMIIFAVLLFFSDGKFGETDFVLFEGTFLFALLIMSVEPKTSPTKANLQYIYGFLFGVINFILMYHSSFSIPIAIVFANSFNMITRTGWFMKNFSKYV